MTVGYIFGIDQTGAVDSKARPKPLPIILLYIDTYRAWKILETQNKTNIFINAFSLFDLNQVLKNNAFDNINSKKKAIVAIDCVLGLATNYQKIFKTKPANSKAILLDHIQKTQSMPAYGFKIAKVFFDQLLTAYLKTQKKTKQTNYPKRRIEIQHNANSIFTSTPFQKNIQTGTFRIWKDLANMGIKDIDIYPYDFEKNSTLLIEGYPSLAWKELNESNRQEKNWSKLHIKLNETFKKSNAKHFFKTKEYIRQVQSLSKDHQDAFMLACQTLIAIKKNVLQKNPNKKLQEGHILSIHQGSSSPVQL